MLDNCFLDVREDQNSGLVLQMAEIIPNKEMPIWQKKTQLQWRHEKMPLISKFRKFGFVRKNALNFKI